jgi:opacity protein-like surface antigen
MQSAIRQLSFRIGVRHRLSPIERIVCIWADTAFATAHHRGRRWFADNQLGGHHSSRFGWVSDRLLVYVTGGLAFTDQHNRETSVVVVNGQFVGPIGSFNLSSSSSIGAVVGAGVEYAWTNQWSVKAEYLHFDFAHSKGGGRGHRRYQCL